MSWLTVPFEEPAFRVGLAASFLIGAPCAALGVYVVLRRMAFIGDALAHTVLPGLVVALLFGINIYLGALAAALLTALGIGWLSRRRTLREDTAIGVLFTAMFALGIVLAAGAQDPEELNHLLLGRLLGLEAGDLPLLAGVAAAVLSGLALLHKELELASFDPTYAEVIGIRTDRLRTLLLVLLAFTVVAGIQAVGVLLTSALLITPAAAASLLTTRLPRMMAIAGVLAIASSVAGLYAAHYVRVSAGAAIVLACTLCFAVAWGLRAARTRG